MYTHLQHAYNDRLLKSNLKNVFEEKEIETNGETRKYGSTAVIPTLIV